MCFSPYYKIPKSPRPGFISQDDPTIKILPPGFCLPASGFWLLASKYL